MQSYTDCICLNFLQCVFLKKKLNASTAISPQSEQASTQEAEVLRKAPPVLHHHPSPSASSKRGHVVVVGREKAMLSFNQLDSSASPSSPAHRPPPPPLTSCTASTQTWFGSTNKFCMAKTHSMYSGPELKWNSTNAIWFVLKKLTFIFTKKPSSSCDKSNTVFSFFFSFVLNT